VSGPAKGLVFAVEGDPLLAWKLKLELVAAARTYSRMTLLGRDFSDLYSPVGARPITRWVEQYDLLAPSGVFTPAEERLVRAFFLLMAHMYMQTDLMNWQFNSRNANFEADRAEVVGMIGLAFPGNPDSARFVRHAAERMDKSLRVYCTPGSGKWYENPACYYLQASKCWMNLAFHLHRHGALNLSDLPRLKDFLQWGVLLLTPPCPSSYEIMSLGTTEEGYRQAEKVRRIPPIGDHAHLGPWVPEHYALIAPIYRSTDSQFADLLMWAYQAGGSDGGYFGNLPLLFAALSEEDLKPVPAPVLASRRLEGFGAVLRDHFDQPDEFYLLFKQGPGGYRFHRTEGSLVLFVHGKPLIYEGGEGGETWRHSTLSFYDSHTPLAPGHVERFHCFSEISLIQGVHPEAIQPGEPVFLSDVCDPALVSVARRRYAEPNPVDSRTVLWVRDEYVILHDELALPPSVVSHWHLQVVADEHVRNEKGSYLFRGRFGTDLQVLLPDQQFAAEGVEPLPLLEYRPRQTRCFTTRHLMLTGKQPDHYLAVLRPLPLHKKPVTARELRQEERTIGVSVLAEDLHDYLFFQRSGVAFQDRQVVFEGQYGAVLRRSDRTELFLAGEGCVKSSGLEVQSQGPAICVHSSHGQVRMTAEGYGECCIRGLPQPARFLLKGNRIIADLRAGSSLA